jgi:hypothetical protein
MLGVEVAGAGATALAASGHRYAWVEMTDYGSPIGFIPEEVRDRDRWHVIELD